MSGETLPAEWSSGQDETGRTYYVNHTTQETTWELPAATRTPGATTQPPAAEPAPYTGTTQHNQKVAPMGHNGRRVTFWGAAFFAWLVWALALAATAGADWISGSTLKVADSCSSYVVDSFCAKYDAFSAMQIIAILILSIAMVVLMGALFCPEEKVRRLGCVGGGLLIAYSVFQLIAVAIFGSLFSDIDFSPTYGDSFGAACAALIFGLITGVILLIFAGSAGEGLVRSCQNGDGGNCCNPALAGGGGATTHQTPAPGAAQKGAPPTYNETA